MEAFIDSVSRSNLSPSTVLSGKRGGGVPWGWILIVGTLIVGGIFLFKKYQPSPANTPNKAPVRAAPTRATPGHRAPTMQDAYKELHQEMGDTQGIRRSKATTTPSGLGGAVDQGPQGIGPTSSTPMVAMPTMDMMKGSGPTNAGAMAASGYKGDDEAGMPAFSRGTMDVQAMMASSGFKK